MKHTIRLAVLLGRTHRADIAIAAFWESARSATAGCGVELHCLAIYPKQEGSTVIAGHESMRVVALQPPVDGSIMQRVEALSYRKGAMGILARLLRYNVDSRRIARTFETDKILRAEVCGVDIIVAADPEADRALWNMRRKTGAQLLHGPFAMTNALAALARAGER